MRARHVPIHSSFSGLRLRGRSAVWLWLYGLGMLGPVAYFVARYPLYPNAERLLDIGKMSRHQPVEYTAFVLSMQLMFGLYVLALLESRRLPARQVFPAVFGCGALLAAGMIFMYPVTAIDLFTYVVRSRLFTTYGANPLIAVFKDYPDDPWKHISHQQWAALPSPYGPLWTLLGAPITRLAGDRVVVAVFGFKVLTFLCVVGGAWAIARTLQATRSPHAATGAMLYLWNPLVLWEGIGNGHNDVVMMFPLLLALLAWARRLDILVIPLIVAAAMIKYVPLPLIPIVAVALWRREDSRYTRRQLVGWSLALTLLVIQIALCPFYDLRAVANSVSIQANILRMSIAAGIWEYGLAGGMELPQFKHWAKVVGGAIVAAVLVIQAVVLARRPAHLPRAVFEILFIIPLAAMTYFNAWYLIWPVAIAALLPLGWPAGRMIVWCVGAMAGYGVMIWIGAWWHLDLGGTTRVAVPVMFTGVLLLTLAEVIWRVGRSATWMRSRRSRPRFGRRLPDPAAE